jgi:hypothetical protein
MSSSDKLVPYGYPTTTSPPYARELLTNSPLLPYCSVLMLYHGVPPRFSVMCTRISMPVLFGVHVPYQMKYTVGVPSSTGPPW